MINSKITMKKKNKKKKTEFLKTQGLILSYQTQLGYIINPELYYKLNTIKITNV